MPDIFFNPYPGPSATFNDGQIAFLATAKSIEKLRGELKDGYQAEGDEISKFCIVRDSSLGCNLNFPEIISSFSGTDRTIAQWFLTLFSRGKIIGKEVIARHDTYLLKGLDLPVPVLEYALSQQGIVATIAYESFWRIDFLEFLGINSTSRSLPNVWGQADLSFIHDWISEWKQRNTKLISQLKNRFSASICNSAIKESDLTPDEWEIIIDKLDEASSRSYVHDGYLVKDVDTTLYGPLKQIKQLGSGLRLYLACTSTGIVIGGFYKKGAGSSPKRENLAQNKAILAARKRINSFHAELNPS